MDETMNDQEYEFDEVDEDVTDVELDDSDDFDLDEDGNIIISADEDETDTSDDGENDDAEQDSTDDETSDKETEPEPAEKPAKQEETPTAPERDERDEENERLRRQVQEYDRLAKKALAKMGVEAKDGKSALIKLAAEAEGVSEDEYVKKHVEDLETEKAREFYKRAKFNEKKARDLAEVHAAYPYTKKYKSVEEFPNFKEFAQRRDNGESPAKAYVNSHNEEYTEEVVRSVKQQSLNGTKDHIKSAVPKGAKNNQVTMTKAELVQWRGMFPDMSDKEIIALYKKTK